MKKTIRSIIEKFPMLEDKLLAHEDIELAADALKSLDQVQRTFLKLACFLRTRTTNILN